MTISIRGDSELRYYYANEGQSIFDALSTEGFLSTGVCDGKGNCGKCRVKIVAGTVSPVSSVEENILTEKEHLEGIRLACQTNVLSDIIIELCEEKFTEKNSFVSCRLPDFFIQDVDVVKSYIMFYDSLSTESIDLVWLLRKKFDSPKLKCSLEALRQLGQAFTQGRRKGVTVSICKESVLAVEVGNTEDVCYGIVFDLGTTSIVGILWDMYSGKQLNSQVEKNPQCSHGGDVISRIEYALESNTNMECLQREIVSSINKIIDKLIEGKGINSYSICRIVVAGNPTMSHCLMGVCPAPLVKAPYFPVFREEISVVAGDLGIHANPAAELYLLPQIASHVGSDITGVMLTSDIFNLSGVTIAVDIGTNGEILIAKDGKVFTSSTAAGPAFEGAGISCGMRAAEGAIEGVDITPAGVKLKVIGNVKPIGICGSGLIDVLAAMYNCGILNQNGGLLTQDEAGQLGITETVTERIVGSGSEAGFVLYKDDDGNQLTLLQRDIREAQLAKGAILGGILTILKKQGICVDEIDRVLIAGAFGNSVNPNSAITIGLLPKVDEDKIFSIGNGAVIGASMVLLSEQYRKKAETDVKRIEYVTLAGDADFRDLYVKSMLFK